MPESVDIFGRKFPKPVVIGIGAAVAGIVGYAWWTRGTQEPLEPTADSVPVDEDASLVPGASGGTVSGTFTPNKQTFETDTDWFNAAVEKLTYDFGVQDTRAASDVLDRYLNNRAMSQQQADMIAYVINSIGPPPSGRRNVKIETPKATPSIAPSAPSRVTAASAGRRQARVSWTSVPGATSYRLRQEDGLDAGTPHTWRQVGNATTWTGPVLMHRPRDLTVAFRVQALGMGGSFGGNRVSNSVSIKH